MGLDWAENPDSDWGRSLAKGVGSVVGGLLGSWRCSFRTRHRWAGSLATGAMAAGGGAAGEAAGDWLYSLFNGEGIARRLQRE